MVSAFYSIPFRMNCDLQWISFILKINPMFISIRTDIYITFYKHTGWHCLCIERWFLIIRSLVAMRIYDAKMETRKIICWKNKCVSYTEKSSQEWSIKFIVQVHCLPVESMTCQKWSVILYPLFNIFGVLEDFEIMNYDNSHLGTDIENWRRAASNPRRRRERKRLYI